MMNMYSEPTVWKDGQLVEKVDHLAATGKPAVQEPPQLGEEWQAMPIPDNWTGVVDNFTLGVRERMTAAGRHEAQAWALCVTDVETVIESPVYGLVSGADPHTPNPLDTSRAIPVRELTGAAAIERAERRATIRARMRADERSPLDMIAIARDLRGQALQKERVWQAQLEQFSEERQLDQECLELFRKVERGRKIAERERKQQKQHIDHSAPAADDR